MTQKTQNKILPFAIVTFIYFIVGFLTTINEQLQAPMKFTFLADAGSYKNTLTTSISFFFFLGYLINGSLGSKWVNLYGYKKTIMRGMLFIISGLALYLSSSYMGLHFPDFHFTFGNAIIPYSFLVFFKWFIYNGNISSCDSSGGKSLYCFL